MESRTAWQAELEQARKELSDLRQVLQEQKRVLAGELTALASVANQTAAALAGRGELIDGDLTVSQQLVAHSARRVRRLEREIKGLAGHLESMESDLADRHLWKEE